MPAQRDSVGRRVALEFVVIVAGVLVALAADRWNQSRIERADEAGYVQRLSGDIRSDSLVAAEYLARFDGIVSARDSLASAVEGDVRLSTVTSTVLRAFRQLNLPAPVTWTELVSSGSLSVIRDAQLRGTLAEYYVTMRPRLELQLSRSDRRGRDPFTDALYPMGFFLPCVPDVPCAEGGADSDGQQDLASSFKELDPATFTGWPGIADLLTGLGSHHGTQGVFARRLLSDASATLRRIEAIRPQERIQPN